MDHIEERIFVENINSVSLRDVEERMVDNLKRESDFQDSSLVVLEVTYKFPTGNFF